jgi:hypothetical protein
LVSTAKCSQDSRVATGIRRSLNEGLKSLVLEQKLKRLAGAFQTVAGFVF